jgi:hypothetical protein
MEPTEPKEPKDDKHGICRKTRVLTLQKTPCPLPFLSCHAHLEQLFVIFVVQIL